MGSQLRPWSYKPQSTAQMCWRQFLRGLVWRQAQSLCRTGALPHQLQGREAPPNCFSSHKQHQQQAEKQTRARQDWGNATQQDEDIICSVLPPQLKLTAVLPGWAGFYTAVKSNKGFLLLSGALACNHHFKSASSSPLSPGTQPQPGHGLQTWLGFVMMDNLVTTGSNGKCYPAGKWMRSVTLRGQQLFLSDAELLQRTQHWRYACYWQTNKPRN